jgi:hypothetical protein
VVTEASGHERVLLERRRRTAALVPDSLRVSTTPTLHLV